jgi:hypothetical protein
VFHVAFDGFHKIWNQVVPARQLYINLCKRVFDAISQVNQTIVDTDCVKHDGSNKREEYYE